MQPVLRIVSGGRSGVDRAALDAALACGLPVGGCSVQEADATLIVTLGEPDGGSRLTAEMTRRSGKPCIVASLESYPQMIALAELLPRGKPEVVLNVAGPRGSRRAGIYARAFGFLATVFRGYKGSRGEFTLTLTAPVAPARGHAARRLLTREPSAATASSLF